MGLVINEIDKKMSDNRPVLVIFCKRPALFQGKQRLAATIGAEQAYIMAKALLGCALEDAQDWPGPVVLSPASCGDSTWADRLLERNRQVLAQSDGCLGIRLRTVDRRLREDGLGRIIFIGTDAPILSPDHYEEARLALNHSDIVLSPARDGGVTIMGSRRGWPDMTGLPWSTGRLARALEILCDGRGHSVKNISPSYDIDREEDLLRLWHDLSGDRRPARQYLRGKIGKFLEQGRVKYG